MSIAAITSKEVAARGVKHVFESLSPAMMGDLFSEKGALADSLLPLALNNADQQELSYFLGSELFLSIVRSVPAISVSSRKVSLAPLISQHLHSILPHKPEQLLLQFSSELESRLLLASALAWEEAQKMGLVYQGKAVTSVTQSIIAGEVASVAAQLNEAIRYSASQLKEFTLFETKYRRAIGNHYSKLKPETLGDVKEIPINDIYVASNVIPISSAGKREAIERDVLLASSFRTVILGNPGGGKSTFAKKLCHDLNKKFEEGLYGGRQLTPVMVVLREYAKYRN